MKTLRVQTISGLASRMRAVIAGIAWAKARGATVSVCWPWEDKSEADGVFPIWFSDLWNSPLKEEQFLKPAVEGVWRRTPAEMPDGSGWTCRLCEPEALNVSALDLTGWPYTELWQPSPLTKKMMASVASFRLKPEERIVGVHIRHSLAQSTTPPIEWFLRRMDLIKQQFPHVRFFLSCDAKVVEEQVLAAYPDTLYQPRNYKYDRIGIARAAADLYLMKQVDWMIGSYNSSYSELMGWMRGGKYLPGWGRPGWMPGGRYEDSLTPPVEAELAKALS